MGLVLASGPLAGIAGTRSLVSLAAGLAAVEVGYTLVALRFLLSAAGRRLQAREDL
jgi:hypothetical protein